MMKNLTLLIALLCLFSFSAGVLAQENALPDPGLTPDSPFYFFKTWKESIQTFFTFGAENKAKQYLHLAEVRLVEYEKMVEMGKTEIAQKTLDKYEKQLNQAVEKAQKVQKKEGLDDVMDAIQERKIKHQGVLTEVLTKAPEAMKQEITGKRSEKWTGFITEVREKFPELISGPVEMKNIPVQVLLGCSVPSVPQLEDCEGGWSLNQASGCPYFSCHSASKRQVQEPPKSADSSKQGGLEKPAMEPFTKPTELPTQPLESKVCIQVITPAVNPKTNVCREFPTPCDVPPDWTKINKCPPTSTSAPLKPPVSLIPSTSLESSALSVPPKPPIPSEPTEIRYYTCPDGVKVESGTCTAKGSCVMKMSPELQCPAQTPPVTAGTACQTLRETKYYTCSDGAKATWCVCGPESGAVGAKNVWRCQHLPELYCPKPVVAPASPETVACCLNDGTCAMETKEHCLAKGATTAGASCFPNHCKATVPVSTSNTVEYTKCSNDKILGDYKCSNGTLLNWKCDCVSYWPPEAGSGYPNWTCVLDPEKLCSTTSDSLAVVWISIPNYGGNIRFFWKTNKPTTSYLEYGLTAAYEFKASGDRIEVSTFDSLHVVEGMYVGTSGISEEEAKNSKVLKSNTLYHFRIVAEDANGNKFVSQDYTFTTSL